MTSRALHYSNLEARGADIAVMPRLSFGRRLPIIQASGTSKSPKAWKLFQVKLWPTLVFPSDRKGADINCAMAIIDS
jgi:hypothetical protein